MNKRGNLIEELRKQRGYLRENFGVKRIGLFGSFARGSSGRNSDVDMVVEFQEPIGLRFIDLAQYLEKLLGRKVDILTEEGIKSIRIKEVVEDIRRSVVYV